MLYSVKTDGSDYKTLLTGVRMVGGYGSKVIFFYTNDMKSGYYYLRPNGKVSRLWKCDIEKSTADRTIFNGKIYSGDKIFDIATKKVARAKNGADFDMCFSNRNYIYYVGETSSGYTVNRIDREGNIKVIDDNAGYRAIIGINESRTVIYNDSSGNVYRQTAEKAPVKLADRRQIEQLFGNISILDADKVSVYNACVRGNKIFLCASYDIEDGDNFYTSTLVCQTGKNGGELTVIDSSLENSDKQYGFSYCNATIYSDSLFIYKYFTNFKSDYKWNSVYSEIKL